MASKDLLHIHAQDPGGTVWIIGNRGGLDGLLAAVEDALESGRGSCGHVWMADGQRFLVQVTRDDSEIDSQEWRTAELPYSGTPAEEIATRVWPSDREPFIDEDS